MAKSFPQKSSGSEDAARAAAWLADTLRGWGYLVHVQEFRARLGGEVALRNVLAFHPGGSGEEELLVLTNYDQAPTSLEAATDTSAAVGTVLALAHALSLEKLDRRITFAFVDGEEWGMLGAAHLARDYPGARPPAAAIVVEDMGAGRTVGVAISPVGQFKGYSPLWLRSLVRVCTTSMGLGFSQPEGFFEYTERAVLISFTDQGPLLGQGIPSVQLSAWGDEPELTREAYHSPGDVYELVTPQAIEAYGRVAECTIRSLEAMPSLPQEGSQYLLVEEDRVIGQPLLLAAQLVLLMPLYLHFGLSAKSIGREGWRELACYAATVGALAASYGLSKLLPLLGLIPYYELYPPPPRHPLLYQPDYAAMALWAGPSAAALYLSLRASRRLGPGHDAVRACELAILCVLSLTALSLNPFGATLLLLPAAYLWPYVRPGRGEAGKALSELLILLGGATVYLLIFAYAARIYLTIPLMLWYLFMGVAYGLFTTESMLLFMAVLAVGLRLLTIALFPLPAGPRRPQEAGRPSTLRLQP